MEREAFLTWLAAVEMGVGEDRTCPRCGAHGSQWPTGSRGDVNAIFAAPAIEPLRTVTGTPVSGLHRKEPGLM